MHFFLQQKLNFAIPFFVFLLSSIKAWFPPTLPSNLSNSTSLLSKAFFIIWLLPKVDLLHDLMFSCLSRIQHPCFVKVSMNTLCCARQLSTPKQFLYPKPVGVKDRFLPLASRASEFLENLPCPFGQWKPLQCILLRILNNPPYFRVHSKLLPQWIRWSHSRSI